MNISTSLNSVFAKRGSRVERELLHFLEKKGYFVVRAAGSGHLGAPDILAFKLGRYLGFEVKSSTLEELRFSREQLERMEEWQKGTGIAMYVAWKIPRKGFKFLPLSYLRKSNKTVVIKKDDAEMLSYGLEDL
ncbi:MAG: hypothetical protein D6769_00400 [Methanobacteriota archaeon]|nr:MAG: hypothetical protein D6769_00400 [Euryarchaeota archaeon]